MLQFDDILIQIKSYTDNNVLEKSIIHQINGSRSYKSILSKFNSEEEEVKNIIKKFHKDNIISSLKDWSLLYWCDNCDLPVLDCICSLCENLLSNKLELKSPSNPKIIDIYYKEILESLNIQTSDNMVINLFIDNNNRSFEIFLRNKIGECTYSDENKCWSFKPTSYYLTEGIIINNKVSIKLLIEANYNRLKKLEKDALLFLTEELDKTNEVPLIYFSGGKDSVVALDLTLKIIKNTKHKKLNILYIDSGIEYSGTVDLVNKIVKNINNVDVNFIHYKNNDLFWKAIELLGPPSEDDLWCCSLLKLLPVRKTINDLYHDKNFLSIEGPRHREGEKRLTDVVNDGRFYRKNNQINELSLRPVWEWTDFDIWLFMYQYNLDIHSAYTQGAQRTTCCICPAHNNDELDKRKDYLSNLWDIYEVKLENWRNKLKYPKEWCDYYLWKNDLPSSDIMKKYGIKSKKQYIYRNLNNVIIEEDNIENDFLIIRGSIIKLDNLELVFNFLKAFYNNIKYSDNINIENINNKFSINMQNKFNFYGKDRKEFIRLTDLLNIYLNCIGCNYCETLCDNIKMKDSKVSIDNSCNQCGNCNDIIKICPISRYKYMNFSYLLKKFNMKKY